MFGAPTMMAAKPKSAETLPVEGSLPTLSGTPTTFDLKHGGAPDRLDDGTGRQPS
jgi:hypothetical protein